MASVLVAYGTGEGQTAKVAERIGAVISGRGHDVTTLDVSGRSDLSVDAFDAVLVGGSVNNRRVRPEVVAFVERHGEELAARPSGFFQLSIASAIPSRWAQEGAAEFVEDLIEATGWHPDRVGLFAGAVKYTRYPPVMRFAFKLAAMVTTGDTDTSRDYEYTDWEEVERFAAEFATLVESRESGPSTARRLAAVAAGLGVALVAYWLAVERRRSRATDPDADRPAIDSPTSV